MRISANITAGSDFLNTFTQTKQHVAGTTAATLQKHSMGLLAGFQGDFALGNTIKTTVATTNASIKSF